MKIDGFRGLRNLELEQLGRFNLLIGENNSGKTSVLEALAILSDPLDLLWWNRVANTRDYSRWPQAPVQNLKWLFQHVTGINDSLEIKGIQIRAMGNCPVYSVTASAIDETKLYEGDDEDVLDGKYNRLARVESAAGDVAGISIEVVAEPVDAKVSLYPGENLLPLEDMPINRVMSTIWETDSIRRLAHNPKKPRLREPIFNTCFMPPYSHRANRVNTSRLSKSILSGYKGELLGLLHSFDPEIKDITTEVSSSVRQIPSTYFKYGEMGYVPLFIFGDGVQCVINLANQLLSAENGILLIDELETALHTSILPKVIKWLIRAASEYKVQIIATTHSLEVVDALLSKEAVAEEDEVVVYRLGSKEGQSTAKRLDQAMLWSLRGEMGLEVR